MSGDWNPIHLWRWSARLMGMKVPIIHGMHTVAKACAVVEAQSGRRVQALSARFKAPIPLGTDANLALDPGGGGYRVFCNGRVAAEGAVTLAGADA